MADGSKKEELSGIENATLEEARPSVEERLDNMLYKRRVEPAESPEEREVPWQERYAKVVDKNWKGPSKG